MLEGAIKILPTVWATDAKSPPADWMVNPARDGLRKNGRGAMRNGTGATTLAPRPRTAHCSGKAEDQRRHDETLHHLGSLLKTTIGDPGRFYARVFFGIFFHGVRPNANKTIEEKSFSKFSFPIIPVNKIILLPKFNCTWAPTELMERSSLRSGAAWHAAT